MPRPATAPCRPAAAPRGRHRAARVALAACLVLAGPPVAAGEGEAAGTDAVARTPFLDLRAQPPIRGDAHAGASQVAVCNACHGADGQGTAPMFPDLAGQSPTYLYVQLKAFHGGQRADPVMAPLVATLDDAAMRDLAAHFAALPADPGADLAGDPTGAVLFHAGDASRGIPPCQGCHGPAGIGPQTLAPPAGAGRQGMPWATIPRLRGQSPAYVAKALRDFRDRERGRTSNAMIMQGVARSLSDADIQALAEYLGAR